MTHALLAPESIDEALFMSQVLIAPSIAPKLDAEYGLAARERVLEKVLPMAGQVIEDRTPFASQAMVDISRRIVKHEALLPDDYPRDIKDTLHGDNQILLYEPPLPSQKANGAVSGSELGPEASEVILEAAKLAAIHPTRKDDDLVALDFLARNSGEAEGRVSKFILETARQHRKARSLMTNLLLRFF